jgi:hypothetical protein
MNPKAINAAYGAMQRAKSAIGAIEAAPLSMS